MSRKEVNSHMTNLRSHSVRLVVLCIVMQCGWNLGVVGSARGESPEATKQKELDRFFENHVRPLLAEHCWSCHGPEKQKGELRLDSHAAVMLGGESGSSVTPGKPNESLLIEAVRYESFEMPPDKKLPDEKIKILERWVELGAPWPGAKSDGTTPTPRDPREKFSEEDRQWWAFQPLQNITIPDVSGTNTIWSKAQNPIDRFVLAKMLEHELEPAPQAERAQLLRRAFFDLIGMPPTAEQTKAFLNDQRPDAFEQLVDTLLESPHYGEHWARHWLDLVRYADSDGYRIDHYRPDAWRYRDYVIDSLNMDKPYDRFVQEQIAGDELFPGDAQALVATGFLRHWIYEYNNRDAKTQWSTILNDITDTTGDVFMGLGFQCAKCHDHKFDPILQRDYFRLQAFFAPVLPKDAVVADLKTSEEHAAKQRAWEEATAELRQEIDAMEAGIKVRLADEAIGRFPPDVQAMIRKPVSERTPYEHQVAELAYRQVYFEYTRLESKLKGEEKDRYLALKKELSKFDKLKPAPLPIALTVSDVGKQAPPVLIPKRSKEPVEPGYLTLWGAAPATIDPVELSASTGRRATLARWLTQPDHPLTTRVIVNRIWQYHFGRGLAPNSSDFGKLGGAPTHPELLDWMAQQFVRDGWSLKQLHRLIVTSATYRQSTAHPKYAEYSLIDPFNSFYWRGDTRRLGAEQIRDAMYAVSGELDLKAGGEGVLADVPRRSIYTRIMRNARDPLLDVFDLPQFFSSESSRNTTTTPVQSLLLINSPEMLRRANALAQRIKKASNDESQQIETLWQIAYARTPTAEEVSAVMRFLDQQRQRLTDHTEAHAPTELVTGKIPYRDGQAIAIAPEEKASKLVVPHKELIELEEFSVETYFQIRSIYDSGTVRTAVSKLSGKAGEPGWVFGVTGKGSRRKPQTLVLQLFGKRRDGTIGEAAVFSDQFIELNKPYYAAATVKLATQSPGTVTFYLKDLSNDDEPMQIAHVPHDITGGLANNHPLTIGGRMTGSGVFDGLIDDVRLTRGVLGEGQLLFTSEGVSEKTVAYWRFEPEPGILHDSSEHRLDIQSDKAMLASDDPKYLALVDLCHAILNSNEFLYVQ